MLRKWIGYPETRRKLLQSIYWDKGVASRIFLRIIQLINKRQTKTGHWDKRQVMLSTGKHPDTWKNYSIPLPPSYFTQTLYTMKESFKFLKNNVNWHINMPIIKKIWYKNKYFLPSIYLILINSSKSMGNNNSHTHQAELHIIIFLFHSLLKV